MKKTLTLLLSLVLASACEQDNPSPSTPSINTVSVELDSITHTNGNETWRTYFSFDSQGRLALITGSGIFENWRREFEYQGDLLSQIRNYNIQGFLYRDSMAYNDQDQIAEIYHYTGTLNNIGSLSSREALTYNDMGQLIESRWTRNGQPLSLLNRNTYQWANGNLIKEEYYNQDVLMFDYDYEYDNNPSPGLYTHLGLHASDNLATVNNVVNQNRNDHNANPDGRCTPCIQVVNYDDIGRVTTMETGYGYSATYHY